MTTTVIKSIGSAGGRDYSTIQAWEDAAPANLTASGPGHVDQIWKGECYNDSEFLLTSAVTISGSTVDSTHYKWLTAAAGESFVDNFTPASDALKYNQSLGVGIKTNTSYVTVISSSESMVKLDRLQVYTGGTGNADGVFLNGGEMRQCIVAGSGAFGSNNGLIRPYLGVNEIVNCLTINMRDNPYVCNGINAPYAGAGTRIVNCTIVHPSDFGSSGPQLGIKTAYPARITVLNTAIFGYATPMSSGTYASGSDYNATDAASLPTGGAHDLTSCVYADQFKNTTSTASDFRAADA
jgi:hypothetical protein